MNRIVEGLKANEGNGNLDSFEGFAYNGNYKKNAGHQVDEYLVSLAGVVPDETLRQWYESEGLKTRDDLRAFGEKLYAEQPESKTEVKAPNNDEVKGQVATEEPKKTGLKVTFGFDTNSSLGRDILPLIKKWQDTFINIMHRRRGYAKQNNKFKSLGEKNGWERYKDADLYAVFDSNGNLIDFADSPRGAYDIALNGDVESFYVVRQQPTEDGYQYNGTTGWLFTNDMPESEWRDNQGKLREEVKAAATRSIEEALPTVMQSRQQKAAVSDEAKKIIQLAERFRELRNKDSKEWTEDERKEYFDLLLKENPQSITQSLRRLPESVYNEVRNNEILIDEGYIRSIDYYREKYKEAEKAIANILEGVARGGNGPVVSDEMTSAIQKIADMKAGAEDKLGKQGNGYWGEIELEAQRDAAEKWMDENVRSHKTDAQEASKTSRRDKALMNAVLDKVRDAIGKGRVVTKLTEGQKALVDWANARTMTAADSKRRKEREETNSIIEEAIAIATGKNKKDIRR